MKRRHLVIASVWAVCFGGASALVACGSDDNTSPVASDSGADSTTPVITTTPMTDAMTNLPETSTVISIDPSMYIADGGVSGLSVYAGQTATIDARGVMDASAAVFAWTVTSVPAGSAISSASLVNATTAMPSLPTDKVGSYVLSVTASIDGLIANASFTVTASAGRVFYGVDDQGAGTSGLSAIDTDGTNGHKVICPFTYGGTYSSATNAEKGVLGFLDMLEGTAGTATTVAFAGPAQSDAAVTYSQLYITNSAASCPDGGDAGEGATAILTQTNGGNGAGYANIAHPRFSPDGTKIAYSFSSGADAPDRTSTIHVVNVDGTSDTVIGFIDSDAGVSGNDTYMAPNRQPEWVDSAGTRVGWTRGSQSSGWEVLTSAIPSGASDPQVFMTCTTITPPGGTGTSTAPSRAVFLANGAVLTLAKADSAVDLLVLTPDATSRACTLTHNLSSLSDAGASQVQAFALSPDQKTVAFLANDPNRNDAAMTRFVLYTVPVDGSSAPVRVGAVDQVTTDPGIRWIAGGTQLAFTRVNDAGASTVATVAVGDAGQSNDLSIGDAGVQVTAAGDGDNTGCSFGGKSAPVAGFFGAAIAALGILRARRRRFASGEAS